jgi:hypothetical protein
MCQNVNIEHLQYKTQVQWFSTSVLRGFEWKNGYIKLKMQIKNQIIVNITSYYP